jgi:DNA-binding transcriptional MerR regulator
VSETTGPSSDGYSGKRTAEIVGISYRQLDYWARTDLIRPSVADARGSGSRRRYSYRDLLELKLVKTLLDNGIKLESIRDAFVYLRDQLGEDVTSAKLVIAGNSAILVHENEQLIDVVNRYQGQGVLNLLARRREGAGRRRHRRAAPRAGRTRAAGHAVRPRPHRYRPGLKGARGPGH